VTDARSDRLPLRSRLFPSDMGCISAGLGSDGIHLDESADGFTKDRRLCFNVCGVLPYVSLITDCKTARHCGAGCDPRTRASGHGKLAYFQHGGEPSDWRPGADPLVHRARYWPIHHKVSGFWVAAQEGVQWFLPYNSWCFAVSTTFNVPWRFFVWFAFLAASIPSVLLSRSMKIEEDSPVDAEERHELISRR
jgi:hypothetical protein